MGNMLEGVSIYSLRVKWSQGSFHKTFPWLHNSVCQVCVGDNYLNMVGMYEQCWSVQVILCHFELCLFVSTLSRGSVSFLLHLKPTVLSNLFMICD